MTKNDFVFLFTNTPQEEDKLTISFRFVIFNIIEHYMNRYEMAVVRKPPIEFRKLP